MVTGEDAQAAGVLGQHRGDAVLRGEVGDRPGRVRPRVPAVPAVPAQVVVQGAARLRQPVGELRVGGELVQPVPAHLPQQPHRVVADAVPQDRVDGGEDVLGRRVPGPAQVVREHAQVGERLGQDGTDGDSTNRTHVPTVGHFFDRSNAYRTRGSGYQPVLGAGPPFRYPCPTRFAWAPGLDECGEHGWSNSRHGSPSGGRPRSSAGQGDRGRAPARPRHRVPRGSRPARRRGGAGRPRRHPAAAGADEPAARGADPLRRRGRARRGRRVGLRDPRVVRPARHLGARRGAEDPRRRGRRADVHRDAAAPGAGPGGGRPDRRRPVAGRFGGAERGGRGPAGRGPPRPAALPRADARAARAPAARPGHRRGPLPAVGRPDPRALRQLVRVLPALRGRHPGPEDGRRSTSGTFATASKRLDAVAEMGFDVVYLPPIHPIGEVNRKGPNNTLTPGPDDPGSPWAIGSRRRRPRRRPPRPGHPGGLRRLRRPRPRARPGGRARPRAAGRPRPPLGDQPPGVVHHPGRRHHRLRREPAQEVPGHLPDQLRQRPERHLPRGPAGGAALDGPRRADLPGRQPAHQAAGVLGVADQGGPPHRPGRHLPLRGVHACRR